MSTIQSIAAQVTNNILKRDDLTATAEDACLSFYKILCFRVPFDELMTLSNEIPCVAGQDVYDLNALQPALKSLADIRITFNSSTRRRLRRSASRVYDALSFQQSSKPATYARWGLKIQLNPPPDSSAYTLRLRYWSKPTIDPTPSLTTIVTPEEWDELIMWETLYRVYYTIGQEEKAMLLAMPSGPKGASTARKLVTEQSIIPKLWNDLLTTISQKENVDEDFGVNPVVRAYSING